MGVVQELNKNVLNAFAGGIATGIGKGRTTLTNGLTAGIKEHIGGISANPTVVQGTLRTSGYKFVGVGRGTAKAEQIIEIASSQIGTVRALLQDEFAMRTESSWDSVIPQEAKDTAEFSLAERVIQLVSGGQVSLVNKTTSRRFWKGTAPMALTLSLKFRAETDVKTEVIDACEMLQRMAAPGETMLGFLAPPGPSPYYTVKDVKNNTDVKSAIEAMQMVMNRSDKIVIRWGNFLYFSNVIIKTVDVRMHNRIHSSGYPISADVDVMFETFEVTTKEELESIYAGHEYVAPK